MVLGKKLRHLFTPHAGNNFRAKILHNSGIFAFIGILLASNIFLRLLDNPALHILGFTSSISIDEVVRATNEERASAGLKPLTYNEKLADAARRKASNMFSENYWAHNSPSGKTPWTWFKEAGYTYVFAGENLAKDFGDTGRMMSAWMASPTHRDNIVSSKYSEIGIAVVPGNLQGSDTVLVVQLFGSASSGSVAPQTQNKPAVAPIAPVQVAEVRGEEVEIAEVTSSPLPTTSPVTLSDTESNLSKAKSPLFNTFNLARILNLFTTALFILALIIDLFLAESSKLSRRVGNNWAHIIFINLILLATTIVNAGKIL